MLYLRSQFDDFFRDMEQSNNLLDNSNKQVGSSWHHMKINVVENDKTYEVSADLPGVSKENIHVNLDHNVLRIAAERKYENEKKDNNYLVSEKRYGSIERTIALPEKCDADSVKAKFENGVLNLSFSKKPEAQKKQITIS